ncbi:MAG TPA: hypothetical protein VMY42_25570 [Thermoguttaceae bacterium]|nr:hypothetical protein [Thermoguttaceae bacterium]
MKYVATFLVMLSISMFSIGCKTKTEVTPTPKTPVETKSPEVKTPVEPADKT